jgi:flagellar protein FlaJ
MNINMENFNQLKGIISKERKLIEEINSLENYMKKADSGEKNMMSSQIKLIKESLRKTNEEIPSALEKINVIKSLNQERIEKELPKNEEKESPIKEKENSLKKPTNKPALLPYTEKGYSLRDLKPTMLERETLKRMKKKNEETEIKKEPKPSVYINFANRWFSKFSEKIIGDKTFEELERDLIKANLQFTSRSYISVIILTTLIAFFVGIIIATFFFFFKIGAILPIITKVTGEFLPRFLRVVWIIILAPIVTFVMMYIYPGMEKSSTESRIEDELPFATIHMSAISGSMIDPSKIFEIIISTHEYPYMEKEFKKLINEINLYGYDLVSAMRNIAYSTPSRKLSELLNGLATTINSGGDLPAFFDKRSQTLLFENRLTQEKKTKAAETFMDIYISLVVAAPMILMILLMMMKMSGLGVSMSTSMITIVMVLAVTMINIVFLTFLQLKK